jgi:outer membrane protein OmpA-like peptidoglycan-associated protein
MRLLNNGTLTAAVVLAFASAGSAVAQTPSSPWVEMESTSVNLGIGSQSGDGVLRLPNLGTNCTYAFKVSGFGAGIQVGVSKISASGPVQNMRRVADLSGDYSATSGEATIAVGGGGISMRNRNGVALDLKSQTQGLNLGFGGQGMTIRLDEPVNNAPKAYVLEFGYNKTWVNKDSRAVLDRVLTGWKCRYANIWLFGHTDTAGKEDTNVDLSDERAKAVRDYLLGAGVVASRIGVVAKGENSPLVATANNVRLRSNRAVVVLVQE